MERYAGNPKNQRAKIWIMVDDTVRRLFDILLSFIGLTILFPFFALVGIAIKRSSPGPVFYWGARAGKNGKDFQILKFRTMYERKESYNGPKVTAENDPRITPLGRILRQTKINELPQLWNVLIGDMSFVGPRPEDPTIAAEWPETVRKQILSVRPGITSPASVVYRNEEDLLQSSTLMDTYIWDILPSKLRLDQIYVRNRSFLTDLDVLFWTAVALLPKLRGFSVPEHLLYWGPLSRFTSQYLIWFLVDFSVSFVAVALAGIIRRMTTPFDLGLQVAVGIAFAIAMLFSLINSLAGLNRINWSRARTQDAFDLLVNTAIVTAVVLVANLVFPRGARFPISVILVSGVLSFIGFLSVRYRSRLLTAVARYWLRYRSKSMIPLGERVLIVGAGEVSRFAIWLLTNENLSQAFSVVGMVDDNPRKIGTNLDGYSVISTTNNIPEIVEKYDIGLILYAISDIQAEDQERILSLCQTTAARIIPIPDIIDNLRAQFPRDEVEREVQFNKVLHNATVDRLTGAYNRQQFLLLAGVEFTRSRRYGHPLSLVLLHIDYGRPAKARHSKAVASKLLQAAAQTCLDNIREVDLLGRFSDNMLVVLLPETKDTGADLVANRLVDKISARSVDTTLGSLKPVVERSIVTNMQMEVHDINEMIRYALEKYNPQKVSPESGIMAESELKYK